MDNGTDRFDHAKGIVILEDIPSEINSRCTRLDRVVGHQKGVRRTGILASCNDDSEMYIHEFFLPSIFAVEKMKENGWDDIKNEDNITAVHVRRGNTLNQPLHHPVRSVAYFEEALDILKPKQLAVFSDDLDWCKQQSAFRDAWFGPGNPPHLNIMALEAASPMSAESVVIDFHLMAVCSNFVISNSTFGWWAAWVSTYFSGETVVYPKDWYGPLVEADYTLMIPQSRNWIGI